MVSIEELVPTKDEDTAFSGLLTDLKSTPFPSTSWSPTGRIHALLRTMGRALSIGSSALLDVAKGSLLRLSSGGWLTLLAREWFGIERLAPTFAEGTVTLIVAAGSGPHTIQPYESVGQATDTGLRYSSRNTIAVTLPAGPSSTVVTYRAESPGAKYNAAVGAVLRIPLAGVTSAFTDTLNTGTWLTPDVNGNLQQGTDEESDASVIARCQGQWDTVGLMTPAEAWLRVARETPGVSTPPTRIYFNPGARGPGTMDIWLASSAGPLPASDLALIQANLLARKSPASDLQVDNAVVRAITVSARVEFIGSFGTAVDEARAFVGAYINGLPLGGEIVLSQVLEEIMAVGGVKNVPLPSLLINGANTDLQIAANEVAVFVDVPTTFVKVVV